MKCWRIPHFDEILHLYSTPDQNYYNPGLVAQVIKGSTIREYKFAVFPWDHEKNEFWGGFKAMGLKYDDLKVVVKLMTGKDLTPMLNINDINKKAKEKVANKSTSVVELIANGAETAVIKANAGFPENRKLGITCDWQTLTVKPFSPKVQDGWAKTHTNLHQYTGWRFYQVNQYTVADEHDFDSVVSRMNPGDPVAFVVVKPLVIIIYFQKI